ncbi:MAG: sialate O-acetylesterase [Verrucomicrobiota bacterium]
MKSLFSLILFLQTTPLLGVESFELHPLFSDHAVLQQGLPVPVWGKGVPGAKVEIEFAGQQVIGEVADSGRWQVVLESLAANLEPQALVATSGETILTVNGVLVGEVWIGSGQSNMGQSVSRTLAADSIPERLEAGELDKVRLFKVPVEGSDDRLESVDATWQLPSESSILSFSATAFYFAAKLSADRSVPVGIIQSANGGTNAFSWINRETFSVAPEGEVIREYWDGIVEAHPEAFAAWEKRYAKWKKQAAELRKEKKKVPRAPGEPLGPDHPKRPTGHYHAMVAPLQPFAIQGVIWYQGEANSREPFYSGYKELMLALVEDWRADWAEASGEAVSRREFPFYLVQLPNFGGGDETGWPMIREQMLKFWQEGKQTGMVVTIDKGEADDIHPQDKLPVGERLATFARANAYGESLVFSGPIFESLRIEDNRAVLEFKHRGSGLASFDGEPLRHFEVAAADGKFLSGIAQISEGTVVVTHPDIAKPRAVRYAWRPNPEQINFGNVEGLPASPFRTDTW